MFTMNIRTKLPKTNTQNVIEIATCGCYANTGLSKHFEKRGRDAIAFQPIPKP